MNAPKVNLVIVAHPDDEILGFGGTGAKLVQRGEIVQPVMLSGEVDVRTQRPSDEQLAIDIQKANKAVGFSDPVLGSFPNIRMNSVPHIELVQYIEKQIADFRPTRIFTHHNSDLNDDHKQISHACLAAARLFQRRDDLEVLDSIHLMEIPSSTDWAFSGIGTPFSPNQFVDISATMDQKLEALHHYRNVIRDFPHPRSEQVIKGLAALRGGQCGLGLAEAFQTVFSTQLN